ncbi:DUF3558 domain-containing protein [Streptomyces sp. NPDC052042]|uniref:DUF3558 domain-containing protein n=1 Tax=Streptomyces sp. NPDC052042 TaxID=3365683 RepID=UPI0037D1BCAC
MAYVPGTALLAALVVGCSAGTGTGGSAADGKPGEATATTAAPGKYRTLLDACRAVSPSSLKDLLPGAAELPEDQQEKAYKGTAAVTYDTDRRVGCRWKAEAPGTSHILSVDFERVVSYDPSVSDDDRAREVYAKKATAVGLSVPSATPDSTEEQTPPPSGTVPHAASDPSPTDHDKGKDKDKGEKEPDENKGDEGLLPRTLDGLGDSAFLDDRLVRASSTAQNRTVSVVFRTSNVVVTVEYAEQPTVPTAIPDSKELQERARSLARKLVEKFGE